MTRPKSTDLELFERGVMARFSQASAGYDGPDVLHGVDFEARAGEVALVTGPTSAGKTTLMQMLRLALPPRTGRVVILGGDANRIRPKTQAMLKRRIGYIAENPVFYEEWSTFENIALPLKLAGRKAKDYVEDVRELVDFVGLGADSDAPPSQLSAAARRRAAIARALAAKPDLILADDPTAGMSIEAGRRVVKLLCEMRRVGAGVVIASQDETLLDCAPMFHWRIDRGRVSLIDHAADANLEAYR